MRAGDVVPNPDALTSGVTFYRNGKPVTTTSAEEILEALDEYKAFLTAAGKEWKLDEALKAMQIDAGWFADAFVLDVVRRFLYYQDAPHRAFPSMEEAPVVWVRIVPVLRGALGVTL